MYDHIGLRVNDIDASINFCGAILPALGYPLCSRDQAGASFGPQGKPALWLHSAPGSPPGGCHVAFSAGDRASVDRFHSQGLKVGGRDNGQPGLRADYSPTYYAAFLLDPDGNNVEAVCMR